jgi:alcohol dehydrogenase class IV
MPNGLNGVGYTGADARALAQGAFPQQRVIRNSPRAVTSDDLERLFEGAMTYW